MNFHIGEDRGDFLVGWLAPDNPAAEPRIVLEFDGVPYEIKPTLRHMDMVEAGGHDTGLVGFQIFQRDFPGLKACKNIRLVDQDSGLAIYVRRGYRSYVEKKLFVFDMVDAPVSRALALLQDAFHMTYPALDRFGNETRRTCMAAKFTRSILVTGGICVRADEPFLNPAKFDKLALLIDPAEYLLESLLAPEAALHPDAAGMIAAGIGRLSGAERTVLTDPLTRRLVSLYVEDPLQRDAVALALDTLADFDGIGVEEAMPEFTALAAALLEVPEHDLPVVESRPRSETAKALRQEPAVQRLIGRDLDVYDAAYDAVMESRRAA